MPEFLTFTLFAVAALCCTLIVIVVGALIKYECDHWE